MQPANSNGGASKRKRRRTTPRLTAAQARAAVEQFVRIGREEGSVDQLFLAEVEKTKGYALVVAQAANDALDRFGPFAVLRGLHDFFLPFATALPDFFTPIGEDAPVDNDGVKIGMAVLDAIANRRPPPYDPDWVWDGPEPAPWLHHALQYAVFAAEKADHPRAFKVRLANALLTITSSVVSGAGVRAARRLVAALDAVGRERPASGSPPARERPARSKVAYSKLGSAPIPAGLAPSDRPVLH